MIFLTQCLVAAVTREPILHIISVAENRHAGDRQLLGFVVVSPGRNHPIVIFHTSSVIRSVLKTCTGEGLRVWSMATVTTVE